MKGFEKFGNEKKEGKQRNVVLEYALIFIVAFAFSFLVRQYVFSRADVSGASMNNTLHDKDVIFLEKICQLTNTYKKGEIVVFDSLNTDHESYIKRVIATEGDTIELKSGKVYLNDQELNEPYLTPGTVTKGKDFLKEDQKFVIEKGYIFVMGDNREHSLDSRTIGPISYNRIIGHTILRVFPFNKFKVF